MEKGNIKQKTGVLLSLGPHTWAPHLLCLPWPFLMPQNPNPVLALSYARERGQTERGTVAVDGRRPRCGQLMAGWVVAARSWEVETKGEMKQNHAGDGWSDMRLFLGRGGWNWRSTGQRSRTRQIGAVEAEKGDRGSTGNKGHKTLTQIRPESPIKPILRALSMESKWVVSKP